MNENEESTRRLQFLRCFPKLLDTPGRLLYVGGHLRFGRALQMTGLYRDAGWTIDVIEVFPDNLIQLQNVRWINALIGMDVREFYTDEKYDCVMLWHGPEHFTKDEFPILLERMKQYSNLLIFASPYGKYEQGDEYGNPYERHLSHWYPKDFEQLELNVDAIGNPDARQGNIIAWWERK